MVQCIERGLSVEDAASAFGVSVRTVYNHLAVMKAVGIDLQH